MNRFGSKIVAVAAATLIALSTGGAGAVAETGAAVQEAGTFVSLDPARVLDTRVGNGAPQLTVAPNATVDLQVSGRGGVPETGAGAVVVNVTTTGSTASGFITVYPSGATQPTASNLNFAAGQTIPNLVTVKLSEDGRISLTNNSAGSTDLIADVAGYYVAGDAATPGAFVSLAPTRVLDTRVGVGASNQPSAWGTVGLQVAGNGGVPQTGVAAVVMNVTVTSPGGGGFLTVYPSGGAVPSASALNFTPGQTIPNLVTVKLGAGGRVDLRNISDRPAHLIADVAGYYLAGTATEPGAFVALDQPTRYLDTRATPFGSEPVEASSAIDLQLTDRFTVPDRAAAAVMNVTVTGPTASGFVTAYPHGDAQPTASNLNFGVRETIPNSAIVKIGGNGRVDLANNSAGSAHLILDVAGYFVDDPDVANEVWPTGWFYDDCGTQWDGLVMIASPGLTYSPGGESYSVGGEEYLEFLPDSDWKVVITVSAQPGFELLFFEDERWTANSDGSITGTFFFDWSGCAARRQAAPDPAAERSIGSGEWVSAWPVARQEN